MTTDPMREAFEKWYREKHCGALPEYNQEYSAACWLGWKACAQTMGEAIVREIESAKLNESCQQTEKGHILEWSTAIILALIKPSK